VSERAEGVKSGVVVVTGAAGGMGAAVCERLASDGYAVVAIDRNKNRLAALREETLGVTAVESDIRSQNLGSLAEAAVREAGRSLRGIVNLAGASVGDSLEKLTDDDWYAALDTNATAPMRLCRALLPLMRAAGGGSIVNVSSPVAILGARKVSYAASKAALLGLNAALARALGRDGIRVNAVLPGPTITYMTNDWDAEKRSRIASGTFLGRLCEPREIAAVISFLIGPDSSYMTGAVLDVTAGALHGGHS
jgi:NAD(P)-dependent dehydrogenase (short-subunit alcohol dehydrogenase family)